MILKQPFYDRDTRIVAQELLGCFLVRKSGAMIIKTKIVETEAYCGPNDLASHASRGMTPRNKVMFGQPGTIYVYFTYGMHYLLNIVTENEGYPAAVLIRAVERIKITNSKLKITNLNYTNGPAKLTKTLQIDKTFNGLPIYAKKNGLWIEQSKERITYSQIARKPRIGVDYAGEYRDKKWRYYLKNNEFVSKL